MTDRLNVVININRDYIMPATVMLKSLENRTCADMIYVYVLSKDLREADTNSIECKLGAKYKVSNINVSLNFEDILPVNSHISIEAYLRCFVYLYVPDDVDRIIYIDSDMIVINSIDSFYNIEFEDTYIVACEDPLISQINKEVYRNLGMRINDLYFNSGLMLLNVKKMKEHFGLYGEMVDYISCNYDKIIFHDQDVLNGFFYQKVCVLRERNINVFATTVTSKKKEREILTNAVVIHYADRWKPWKIHYVGYFSNQFWDVANKLGYQRTDIHQYRFERLLLNCKRRIKKFKLEICKIGNLSAKEK